MSKLAGGWGSPRSGLWVHRTGARAFQVVLTGTGTWFWVNGVFTGKERTLEAAMRQAVAKAQGGDA
jgi:hypothetical protein